MDTKLKEEWSSNRFRHLVNNSVGKHNENFSRGFVVEETNEVVNGYMWSLETFKKVNCFHLCIRCSKHYNISYWYVDHISFVLHYQQHVLSG